MKKILFFLTISFSLFAAVPTIYVAPPTSSARAAIEGQPQKEKKSPATITPLSEMEKAAAAANANNASSKGSTEMMIISPEGRAKDIQAAIQYLHQRVPTSKPTIKLTDGSSISGIISIDVMPGGTILIFKINSLKGVQYQIEKIENIDTLMINGT